jgi:hypothetical protein
MKPYPKKKALTFGELVASVCGACGRRQAAGILRLAVEARVIQFGGLQRLVISPPRASTPFHNL